MFRIYGLMGLITALGAIRTGFRRGGVGGAVTGLAKNRIRAAAHRSLARNLRRWL